MRRPLALAGFTFLFIHVFCVLLGKTGAQIVLAAAGAVFVFFLLVWQRRRSDPRRQALCGVSFFAACAAGLYLITGAAAVAPMQVWDGTTLTLEMVVEEEPSEYGAGQYYIVSAAGLWEDSDRACRLELVTHDPYPLQVGDVVRGRVALRAVTADRQAGQYASGVFLRAVTPVDAPPEKVGVQPTLRYYAAVCRGYLQGLFQTYLSRESAALVCGVCFGDTHALSARQVQALQACGVSHTVAVSGLHTGMVAGWCLWLFLAVKTRRRWVHLLGAVFVWGFVFVAGLPYSALRSAIMFTALSLGAAARRKADPINSLGGAVLLILLLFPLSAGDIGFLASVSACGALLLGAAPLARGLRNLLPVRWQKARLAQGVTAAFGVTLAAWLGMIPCNLLRFKFASLAAPVANLVCVPLAGVILMGGLGSGLLSLVPGAKGLLWLPMGVVGLAAKGLNAVTDTLSRIPFVRLPQATLWVLPAAGLLLTGLWYTRKHPRWVRRVTALMLTAVLVGACCLPARSGRSCEILVMGDDRNAAVAVLSPGETVVIGCDDPYTLQRMLASRGIRQIDCLILPDRSSYFHDLHRLLDRVPVHTVVISQQGRRRGLLAGLENRVTRVCHDQRVAVGGVTVTTPDFGTFAVTAGGRTITYRESAPSPARPEEELTVVHPDAAGAMDTAALLWQAGAVPVDGVLSVRFKGADVTIHRLRVVY